ncbi:polynucleotide adenylyltransferase PcnB [Robbsia sp. KACC 23696]|uniref:polynucleotide adenylyltransferase PcnB n=1 Tax=Robbsia sp. KACC 23696 TaxID=3149231 RepID=UPI00325AF753
MAAETDAAGRAERATGGGVARRARSIRAASGNANVARGGAKPGAAAFTGSDTPVVIPADVHGINPNLISRNAVRVTDTLQQAGFRAFIVGGAVRDLLFGVAPKDFDVATDATPDQVQKLFRRARIIGRRFQINHVQFGQDIIEVSTFRALVDPAATPETAAADNAATAEAEAAIVASAAEAGRGAAARTTVTPNDSDSGSGSGAVDADDAHDSDDAGSHDDARDNGHDGAEPRGQDAPRGPNQGGRGDRRNRRRREDPDRRLHAVDASGRVVRDNVWGEQHEDARRRDFTINAMYYDPSSQTVLDYHEGMADMRARTLRMIGDPETRYREDPVRMMRVVRFAAKLGFDIEPATRAPIAEMADLLNNVPAARIFDEMLKLLLSGHALACLTKLRTEGLLGHLLPMLDSALSEPVSEKFITLSLTNTDQRIRSGKPVSPGFLFAALLWHETQRSWKRYMVAGELPIPALHRAMDEVMNAQIGKLAIQRRYVTDMKEIWGMQPRLEKRAGRSALKLLEHPKFRAAYDFLLLRCESEELEPALGQWWTDFITGDFEAREALLNNSPREAGPRARPRRRRRRGGQGRQDGGQDHDGGADVPTPTV